jgi:hypothetical protein
MPRERWKALRDTLYDVDGEPVRFSSRGAALLWFVVTLGSAVFWIGLPIILVVTRGTELLVWGFLILLVPCVTPPAVASIFACARAVQGLIWLPLGERNHAEM